MELRQVATRVDEEQYRLFKEITKRLGTTTSDALRMFVYSFNESGGFPYEVRTKAMPEPFKTEEEATRFATSLSMGLIDETR